MDQRFRLALSKGPNRVGVPETEAFSFYWAHLSMFHLKTEIESSLRNIVFNIVIVILIYHRHKPIDSINLFGS
jgi:hypothetical protein